MDDQRALERVAHVEALLGALEDAGDERALDAVGALVELYGEALARVMATADPVLAQRLAEDELVSHLLLVHGLHPSGVEERVRDALEEVKPYLGSHGGGVHLLGVTDEGVVRLALEGTCNGCPSSSRTLELAIEEAIHRAAPEVERIDTEGAVPAPVAAGPSLPLAGAGGGHGPLPMADGADGADGRWATAGGLPQLRPGGLMVRRVGGERVLFASLDHTFYAYRPACPSCGESLEGAALAEHEGALTCPGCGHRYDVRRAGRCLDAPQLHLDPLPLLVGDAGIVRVAVA